jgi:Amt family ammonium transporter
MQMDLATLEQRVTAAAVRRRQRVDAHVRGAGPDDDRARVLALFYGGLVRQKNTLAIMMQSFALMALITVLWALVGYSLCFGEGTPIIGGFGYALLRGVGVDPNADYGGTIPHLTFMVYQLMFAIITPALITGATAERMKFSGTVVFMTLWSLCVYAPLAHMVWGKGGMLNATLGGRFPTLDFAGGTVVHITSGCPRSCARCISASAPAIRRNRCRRTVWCSASSARACCGSAGSGSTPAARSPRTVSRRAPSSRPISPPPRRRSAGSRPNGRRAGRPSALGAISGAVAGLVAITPASGFVTPMPALVIGLTAGIGCFLMVTFVKGLFGTTMRSTHSACTAPAARSARC